MYISRKKIEFLYGIGENLEIALDSLHKFYLFANVDMVLIDKMVYNRDKQKHARVKRCALGRLWQRVR